MLNKGWRNPEKHERRFQGTGVCFDRDDGSGHRLGLLYSLRMTSDRLGDRFGPPSGQALCRAPGLLPVRSGDHGVPSVQKRAARIFGLRRAANGVPPAAPRPRPSRLVGDTGDGPEPQTATLHNFLAGTRRDACAFCRLQHGSPCRLPSQAIYCSNGNSGR